MASFKACEKHGGQLYPDSGSCPLCDAGVVTATREQKPQPSPASGTGRTRKF